MLKKELWGKMILSLKSPEPNISSMPSCAPLALLWINYKRKTVDLTEDLLNEFLKKEYVIM